MPCKQVLVGWQMNPPLNNKTTVVSTKTPTPVSLQISVVLYNPHEDNLNGKPCVGKGTLHRSRGMDTSCPDNLANAGERFQVERLGHKLRCARRCRAKARTWMRQDEKTHQVCFSELE